MPVFTKDFPECIFIAVTGYKNAELIQLKVEHNHHASAFRFGDSKHGV